MKICTKCKKLKSVKKFYTDKYRLDGYTYHCKLCYKKYRKLYKNERAIYHKKYYHKNKLKYIKKSLEWRRKNKIKLQKYHYKYNKKYRLQKYNLNLQGYFRILKKQHGVCAICNKKQTRRGNNTNKLYLLDVDHNHKTGKIRGLLCGNCNKAIGLFNENILIFQNAIRYLRKEG